MTSDHPDVWEERDVAATLSPFDLGSETRAVELVVQPAALRGRDEGVELEVGPEGAPSNALRAGDTGGSSRAMTFSHTAGIDCQPSSSVSPTMKAGHDSMPSVLETVRTHPRPGSNSDGLMTISDTTVRRLTPTECERLQGFPDGHTATSNGKPQADSARYRQMGNAVAVPVFEWVFAGIVEVDARERLNEPQ